jgi:hypothetical protein
MSDLINRLIFDNKKSDIKIKELEEENKKLKQF